MRILILSNYNYLAKFMKVFIEDQRVLFLDDYLSSSKSKSAPVHLKHRISLLTIL